MINMITLLVSLFFLLSHFSLRKFHSFQFQNILFSLLMKPLTPKSGKYFTDYIHYIIKIFAVYIYIKIYLY